MGAIVGRVWGQERHTVCPPTSMHAQQGRQGQRAAGAAPAAAVLTCAGGRAGASQHELHPRLLLKALQAGIISIAEQHRVGERWLLQLLRGTTAAAAACLELGQGAGAGAQRASSHVLQGPDAIDHLGNVILQGRARGEEHGSAVVLVVAAAEWQQVGRLGRNLVAVASCCWNGSAVSSPCTRRYAHLWCVSGEGQQVHAFSHERLPAACGSNWRPLHLSGGDPMLAAR